MRWLINYIRSCFCTHDWELLHRASVWEDPEDKYPLGRRWIYRCKKCGYTKVVKDY